MEEDFEVRRPRSRNWNTGEKFFLFEHVKNRFDIITDPRKEAASINSKRRVWEQIYQAIAKEFGPLEEHLARGKGGEKCRTQWKNLVQAARKEYKQYMEAKMVGKRHNMTLLSRKICRLMSIDLDDGVGEDNEENDWTEDHPEFRYQPELCQELKESARRINEEYAAGLYDALPDSLPDDFDDSLNYAEVGSDSEVELQEDDKDEDYAPSSKKSARKRRRASSGKSSSKTTPTRVSARAQAAQAKKLEEQKQSAKRQRASQDHTMPAAGYQMTSMVAALDGQTQQEIFNLHMTEHKKRMTILNAEHKAKMANLKLEKEIMSMQRDYWAKKLVELQQTMGGKGRDEEGVDEVDENYDDGEEAIEGDPQGEVVETGEVGPSADLAPKSDTEGPPTTTPEPAESAIQSQAMSQASDRAVADVPPVAQVTIIPEAPQDTAMESMIQQTTPGEGYLTPPNQGMASLPPPQNQMVQ